MEQEQDPRPKFDPQAALEELERFGRDIQRYRAQREAVGDQFETFVQSFKAPIDPAVHADRPLVGRPRELPGESAVASAAPNTPDPVTPPARAESPVFETPATEISPPAMTPLAESIAAAADVTRPPGGPPIAAIVAGAALLLGGGLLAAVLWQRGPAPAENAAGPAATSAPAAAPAPAPVTTPPAAPPAVVAAPAAGESEIVTDRQVWMRVIVDGARLIEREVPAGTKIPIKAEKTIVIRTGDAGAVRLSIRGGTSTPLGREGEVVTRSFTVPPRSGAAR